MPRRLSNPEWSQFLTDVDLNTLGLPPWGSVIQWGNQYILVYICPSSGSICQQGEAMLTDISDRADLLRNIPRTYDASQEIWYYQLPSEAMQQIVRAAGATLQATGIVIQTVAEQAGKAAGALTAPLLENLTPTLVILGLVLVLMYLPSRPH